MVISLPERRLANFQARVQSELTVNPQLSTGQVTDRIVEVAEAQRGFNAYELAGAIAFAYFNLEAITGTAKGLELKKRAARDAVEALFKKSLGR